MVITSLIHLQKSVILITWDWARSWSGIRERQRLPGMETIWRSRRWKNERRRPSIRRILWHVTAAPATVIRLFEPRCWWRWSWGTWWWRCCRDPWVLWRRQGPSWILRWLRTPSWGRHWHRLTHSWVYILTEAGDYWFLCFQFFYCCCNIIIWKIAEMRKIVV